MKIIEQSNNCDCLTGCELLAVSRGRVVMPWTGDSFCAACRETSCAHAPDLIADLSR